jgi:hypothetical protein
MLCYLLSLLTSLSSLFITILVLLFSKINSMVLDDAVEIDSKKNARQEVGRILLKGDAITLLQEAQPVRPAAPPEATTVS